MCICNLSYAYPILIIIFASITALKELVPNMYTICKNNISINEIPRQHVWSTNTYMYALISIHVAKKEMS
jgi:hypothetical protein